MNKLTEEEVWMEALKFSTLDVESLPESYKIADRVVAAFNKRFRGDKLPKEDDKLQYGKVYARMYRKGPLDIHVRFSYYHNLGDESKDWIGDWVEIHDYNS